MLSHCFWALWKRKIEREHQRINEEKEKEKNMGDHIYAGVDNDSTIYGTAMLTIYIYMSMNFMYEH